MELSKKLETIQNHSGYPSTFYDDRYDHCRTRYEQRYNATMTREDWQAMNLAIFTDDATATYCDMGDTNESSLYRITWNGEDLLVAFSEPAMVMMTIFPRNDCRLRHSKAGTLEKRATCDADLKARDQRRRLAHHLPDIEPNADGHFILPVEEQPVQEPKAANVFTDALKDLVVTPRPILTVVPPAPALAPAISPEVAAIFATLNRRFKEQREEVVAETTDRDQRVADLESQITALRAGDAVAQMKGEYLDMAERLAADAFAKHRDGVFDDAAAISMARLMLASQPPAAPVVRAPSIGPRNALYYTHDGKTRTLNEWSISTGIARGTLEARIRRGMSIADALTTPLWKRG